MRKLISTILPFIIFLVALCGCEVSSPSSSPPPISTSNPSPELTTSPSVTPPPLTTVTPFPTPTFTPIPTPTPTVQLPVAIEQVPVSTELISRTYQWNYGGKQWTWELKIAQSLYDYYKGLPRSPTKDYSVYVTHPLDDEYIDRLVNKLNECAQQEGYGDFQKVSFAVAFVQSLPYTDDSVTAGFNEYPRYPVETLVDNGGDCEDTSILTASLIQAMGYGTVLLSFPSTPESAGHCAVGVKGGDGVYGTYWKYNDNKYYYLETTGTGWEIGEVPEEYKNAQAHIYPMIPVPILTHSWTMKGNGNAVELHVTVNNLGSADAVGVYVYAGFDAGNNMMWNPQESPLFNLGMNESVTANFNLIPPYGKHTRLEVQIVYNGYSVENSYSEWFDT